MSNTMPKSAALFEIIHPPDDLRKKVVVASGPEFNLDLVIAGRGDAERSLDSNRQGRRQALIHCRRIASGHRGGRG